MDLLRINSSKLKITLSAAECERYGIKECGGEFDSRSVREVVADILDEAGAGGFCKPREKLLVQLYPTGAGGAELFITKLSGVGEREQRAIRESENLTTYTKERALFLFESFSDLLSAARLKNLKRKNSDLYLRSDGKYLLVIDEQRGGLLSDCDILSEFATRQPPSSAMPEPEWDRRLAEGNAMELLDKLCCG